MQRELFSFFTARATAGFAVVIVVTLASGCAAIRVHRQVDQPLGPELTTGIGGTLFLNKQSDLPNIYGGRDIYGGKVDRGFAEMRLAGIEGQTLLLDVVDINRQSSETTMDRYGHLISPGLVKMDVQQSINLGATTSASAPTRIRLDTRKQRDLVISGIHVTFVEIEPYSVRYTLKDLQPASAD